MKMTCNAIFANESIISEGCSKTADDICNKPLPDGLEEGDRPLEVALRRVVVLARAPLPERHAEPVPQPRLLLPLARLLGNRQPALKVLHRPAEVAPPVLQPAKVLVGL